MWNHKNPIEASCSVVKESEKHEEISPGDILSLLDFDLSILIQFDLLSCDALWVQLVSTFSPFPARYCVEFVICNKFSPRSFLLLLTFFLVLFFRNDWPRAFLSDFISYKSLHCQPIQSTMWLFRYSSLDGTETGAVYDRWAQQWNWNNLQHRKMLQFLRSASVSF